MDEPLDLSVAIMCRNNADTIGCTLASVAPLAGEIVAVDSGSTDGTIEILEGFGARIERVTWQGYVATCRIALELCTRRWVLAIDTDESLEEDLAASIRSALRDPDAGIAGFTLNRKVWYRGRFLNHAWQPERRLRIVRRDLVPGTLASMGDEPHHRLDWAGPAPGGLRIEDLRGTLRHDTIRDLPAFLSGQIRLASQGAATLRAAGVRAGRTRLIVSPAGAFCKQILIKQAWRDGWRGWVAAGACALSTLAKHTMLMERQDDGE